jgi:hypothetical protein
MWPIPAKAEFPPLLSPSKSEQTNGKSNGNTTVYLTPMLLFSNSFSFCTHFLLLLGASRHIEARP